MKKKVLAKNKTALADILNAMDGKRKGLTRQTLRQALKLFLTLETTVIVEGKTRSLALMLRSQARKNAAALIKKRKAAARAKKAGK